MIKRNLLTICGILLCLFVSACAHKIDAIAEFQTEISSGSLTGTDFNQNHSLTSKDEESVIFFVKNIGTVDVRARINDDEDIAITLAPGEEGQIFCKVTKSNKSYGFKVVPTPNGGHIGIEYRIYQETSKISENPCYHSYRHF